VRGPAMCRALVYEVRALRRDGVLLRPKGSACARSAC